MGGYISLAATRGCRATLTFTTAALASCALLLPFAGSASAAPAAQKVFPANAAHGLTEPMGLAVTPDGRLWASDHLLGVCRVDTNEDTPVAERTLIRDRFCAPEAAEVVAPEGAEPPEGTEPPAAPATAERPSETFQIAFDSRGCAPGTTAPDDFAHCNFYVAEGGSGSSGVWRMHWNPDTKVIDLATKIYDDGGTERVMALALGPDGAVDFATKRTDRILRIENAATANGSVAPTLVGFTNGAEEASSLANVGGKTYIAQDGHLSVIDSPQTMAKPLDDPPSGAFVTSLAAGPEGVLFVGTSRPQLTDAVLTYREGDWVAGAYDRGFANVTAMALAPPSDHLPKGGLYIAHGPLALLDPGIEPEGQAEVFVRPWTQPNPPGVKVRTEPPAFTNTPGADFAFEATDASGPATFECVFDTTVVECADGTLSVSDLSEGTHELTVRAATAASPGDADYGVAERVRFVVDRTDPVVEIESRSSDTAIGGRLRLFFHANDTSPTGFRCRVDGGDEFGCDSGFDPGLALGAHTITVFATDAAGNRSDVRTFHVTAVPAPQLPVVALPAPIAPAPAPAAPAATPVVTPVTKRVPQIDINVPCVAVSASRRERARYEMDVRRARITYRAPAKARFAKFTLRRAAGGRRDAAIVETLGYSRVRRTGEHRSSISLTRTQRALVRAGRMRLAVAYGTCRTQVGRWQWISDSDSTTKGKR